jgi:hypothetical protein
MYALYTPAVDCRTCSQHPPWALITSEQPDCVVLLLLPFVSRPRNMLCHLRQSL